jgi:MoaA/NifB/PqqE/SkfB family radical SAM enzyme
MESLGPVLDHLVDNGVRMVSITGGEPLLHPHLLDICLEIEHRGMMISYVATNGLLMDDTVARGLSDAGVNIVGISVDVTGPDGRGVTRGLDVASTAIHAKRSLDRYGVESYAGVVLGTHTRDVPGLMDLIRSWGFRKVIFSYPQTSMASSYRAAEDCEFTRITELDATHLVEGVEEGKRSHLSMSVFNTRENLAEFLRAQSGLPTSFECPAGLSQFYLDWDYDLYRCFNDGTRLGNLVELAREGVPLRFGPGRCAGCTQQAFLDYASFYHAFGVARAEVDSLRRLDLRVALSLLGDARNRRALGSLFEAYLGGFV